MGYSNSSFDSDQEDEIKDYARAVAGGGEVLEDSGTDNTDGGDQYVLPAKEDSVDLQDTGDIQNADRLDAATVNTETIVDGGSGNSYEVDALKEWQGNTSAASASLGSGWTTESANNPVVIELYSIAETDGSTSGVIKVEVDESGGTTADYLWRQNWADQVAGSSFQHRATTAYYLPAGAQHRIINDLDPNSNNRIGMIRRLEL